MPAPTTTPTITATASNTESAGTGPASARELSASVALARPSGDSSDMARSFERLTSRTYCGVVGLQG